MTNHDCDCERVDGICSEYGNEARHLIAVLQDTQKAFRFLPEKGLKRISGNLGLPLSRVYEVATFYKAFSLTPRGEHEVKVCMGTACHLRGAKMIQEDLERTLGIKNGETTADEKFSLESVNCVGACAMAPVVVVDEAYHGSLSARKASRIVKKVQKAAATEKPASVVETTEAQ
jgi:NADH:ubiquinone oxidoreductase subunit E